MIKNKFSEHSIQVLSEYFWIFKQEKILNVNIYYNYYNA